jgi:diguanylate cyclase (GGDEF)-like protein
MRIKARPEMLLFHMLDDTNSNLTTSGQKAFCAENTDVLIALYKSDGSLSYQNPSMTRAIAHENTSFTTLFNQPDVAKKILQTLETEHFSEIEQELVTRQGLSWHSLSIRKIPGISNQASSILVSATDSNKWHIAEKKAKDLAQKDALTKLPNRAAMSAHLRELTKKPSQHLTQDAAKFGLFFIDLDRFKVINDSLGHSAGDILLLEVARRLLITNGEHGNVYRLGGDEFVVIFNQLVSTDQLTENAKAIIEAMRIPAIVGEHKLRIRPSIGICTYPADAETISELLQRSDAAMYLAKAEGSGYRFYDASMTKTHADTAIRRMSLENDLAAAVELNQFELYYQPKISCADLTVSGVEALLRWHHPEKGMVPPDEFIKIAEESSQIAEVGRWVLDAAMKQQQKWKESGISIPVAINISAGQFQTGDLVNQVAESMRSSGCDPQMIELEITESMLLGDGDHIQNTLQHLSSMGIMLALDDFGTGFSNLAYLQKYPLDMLKIDKIFLADQKRSMLLETILNMGKVLGLSVVAEGVETSKQADWLIRKGCDYLQGFYYSRPLTAADTTQYLLDHGTGQLKLSRSAA